MDRALPIMNVSLKARLGSPSVLHVVALILLVHVALLIWQALVVQINNDGILYVRAARLFAERGFHGVSMDDLGAAGTRRGT